MKTSINIKKLHPDARIPTLGTLGAAACDLYSIDSYCLEPQKHVLVRTGLAMTLPDNTAGLILPRSGLALKQKITVLNSPGCLDPDYSGEVCVMLINFNEKKYVDIKKHDRIAQLLIIPKLSIIFNEVEDLETTIRGAGG